MKINVKIMQYYKMRRFSNKIFPYEQTIYVHQAVFIIPVVFLGMVNITTCWLSIILLCDVDGQWPDHEFHQPWTCSQWKDANLTILNCSMFEPNLNNFRNIFGLNDTN